MNPKGQGQPISGHTWSRWIFRRSCLCPLLEQSGVRVPFLRIVVALRKYHPSIYKYKNNWVGYVRQLCVTMVLNYAGSNELYRFSLTVRGSYWLPRAHAQQGVKWSSLSFCLSFFLSFCKKKLRWRELATFRTSECIRRFESPSYLLTCTCHWADSLPLSGISAVFLIIRSTLSAILFMATSHAHKLYATCTLTFMPTPAPRN